MQRKMLVLGIGIFAAVAIWYGLSQSSAPATTIVTSGPNGTSNTPGGIVTAGPVDKDTQQILEILLALRTVKLDDAIFSNTSFLSLKDFSTQIMPEPVGRPDPFAPLGSSINTSVLGAVNSVPNTPASSAKIPQVKKTGN